MMAGPPPQDPGIDDTVCKWCEKLIRQHNSDELTKCVAKELTKDELR